MADVDKKMKVSIVAEDKTGDALKNLGKNLEGVKSSSAGLTDGLTKLGLAGAAVAVAWKAFDFMKQAVVLALEDEKALFQLQQQVEALGISFDTVEPKIAEFEKRMASMGQPISKTDDSITLLARVTGDLNIAMGMSKLASDLAASGMGDVTSNSQALANMFNGKMRQAAQAFGIDMRDNATATEIFDVLIKRATTSTEEMATKNFGRIEAFKTQFSELAGSIGESALGIIDSIWQIGVAMFEGKTYVEMQADREAEEFEKLKDRIFATTMRKNDALKAAIAAQAIQDAIDKKERDRKSAEEAIKTQEQLTEKIKQSFRDIASAVVSSLKDQQRAIDALQKSMKDLDKAMQDDLAKSQENYKQSVADMARAAKDKITQLDKDIADEKESRSQGWRTKVADLEKQKAEQQNIINRAGNEIGDIQNEINKDDLTLLAEKHTQEMQAIKTLASDKKAEMQKEVDDRSAFAAGLAGKAGEAGFADKAINESMSFLGSIGAGPISQSFIFNLPGVVAGDDGIKKIITQMIAELNRQATLRNVGGK